MPKVLAGYLEAEYTLTTVNNIATSPERYHSEKTVTANRFIILESHKIRSHC